MAERLLVTKLVRTDNTRADLYGKGHQYKDLTLFDLGDLAAVGIDPAALPIGQEVPCRFWAVYTISDKLNKVGRPYRDILALERIDTPATATSTDSTALLAELRAIRALLTVIAEAGGLTLPELPHLDAAEPEPGDNGAGDGEPAAEDDELEATFPRYLDGKPLGDNPAERLAFDAYRGQVGKAPASVEALRSWYAGRNGKGNTG